MGVDDGGSTVTLEVVAIVRAAGPGAEPVEVTGSGYLAGRLRTDLGVPARAGDDRPGTIVETTGETAEIVAALMRVRDLGTVVLAGPATTDSRPIDLYADLHVRGLTVIGVAGRT
jgi:hypothetical protein